MSRINLHAAFPALVLAVMFQQSAVAQVGYPNTNPYAARRAPSRFTFQTPARPIYYGGPAANVIGQTAYGQTAYGAPAQQPAAAGHHVQRGYPQLDAPLYPSPVQNIPIQCGGTILTNPAFAPHEMLHAHEYRGLYPPYYYKVKGSWIVTPFGVESHDKWKLQGTEVKVKYKTSFGFLPQYFPRFLK